MFRGDVSSRSLVVGSHLRREGTIAVDVGLADLRAAQATSNRPDQLQFPSTPSLSRRKHVQMTLDMLAVE
jgi:hypothetical protein